MHFKEMCLNLQGFALLPFQMLQRHLGVPLHLLSLFGRKEAVGCLLTYIPTRKYEINFSLAIDLD